MLGSRRTHPTARRELGAGTGTVGEDVTQPREGVADGREHRGSVVAILDVGGVDLSGNQQAAGVGEDVTFAALDLLARVKAPRTAVFRGLDRLVSGRRLSAAISG